MAVIRNVGTPSNGNRVVSGQTNPASTDATETTVVTVNDAAVMKEWQNYGAARVRIRGDGRIWLRVLTSPPTSPTAGDVWLEVSSGVTYLRFYDGTTTNTVESSGTDLAITTSAALLQGMAVRGTVSGLAYAQALVDSNKVYKVVGIMAEDALISTPGTVLTAGDHLALSDWSLITGTTTLTPGADYYLTSTPGRYSTTPDVTVASRVGRAVSTTTLVVQPDLVVIS